MPTAPTLVQSKSGTGLGTEGTTPVVASLDSAVTAGNMILILVSTPETAAQELEPVLSAKPEGFITDLEMGYGPTTAAAVCALSRVASAGEATAWDLYPIGASVRVNWAVQEWSGLPVDPALVTYASFVNFVGSAATAFPTGTTGTLGHSGTLQIAMYTSTAATTWSGYTAGFTERADLNQAPSLAVASAYSTSTSPATCSALQTLASNFCLGAILVYRVADATFDAPLVLMDGFERGTHNGIASTVNPTASTRAATAVVGTVGTDIIVQPSSAAGSWSGYGLRIAASGAAKYVRWDSNILGAQRDFVAGFHLRVVSSTGQPRLAEINTTFGASPTQLVYDTTTEKLGVRWQAEPISWQDGTTPPGTWVWVDWQVAGFGGTSRRMQWAVDHVAQPAPLRLGGQIATPVDSFNIGSASAWTVTTEWDDLIVGGVAAAFPHTRHHVRLLPVDPAGTPSVSGTAANFNVFTANTTLAAWDPTNARNAIDDVPPTISASSDGVTQTLTAASDYAEFPMSTYVIAGPEVCTGVRVWAAAWGGTGAGSGTMRIDGFDGTNAATLYPIGTAWDPDSLTTPSSTAPPWITAQWVPAGGWTQAKLDAAALRFGFSSDATPDMGVHNLMLEAAIRANEVDEKLPVHSWRVDYTDGTSHASAAGPPTVTTGVRGVVLWHDPAPYITMDHGWDAYRIAGVTLFGETEDDATFEAWRLSVLAEPHPLA